MKTKLTYLGLFLFLSFYSCKKDAAPEPTEYPFVILSEINDISSQGATYNANITNFGNQKILDYGFVWSYVALKPTITNSISKSFGNDPTTGVFSYRVFSDLETGKNYYVRAYIKTDKVIVYSNCRSFISKGCLAPIISTFYPDSGTSGRIVSIIGKNFSLKSTNNKVYFGTVAANVIKSTTDTILVRCPNISQTISVKISIEVGKNSTISASDFILICPWSKLTDFPGGSRYWNSFFTINSKGYVCLGKTGIDSYAAPVLWEYDSCTDAWTERQAFPANQRSLAIGFSIGGKGYIGLGEENNSQLKDLWEYDPMSDSWSQKKDFPGSTQVSNPLYSYYVLNYKLYLFFSNKFWEYNPQSDVWNEMPHNDLFLNKRILQGISYNDKGYFIQYQWVGRLIFWEYKPVENVLQKVDSILPNSSQIAVGFTIDNKLYLPNYGTLMEYDLQSRVTFYYNAPTWYDYNYMLIFGHRAILGITESTKVYEFYPR